MTDTPTHHPTADATRERIADWLPLPSAPEGWRYERVGETEYYTLRDPWGSDHGVCHEQRALAVIAALTPPAPPAEGDKDNPEEIFLEPYDNGDGHVCAEDRRRWGTEEFEGDKASIRYIRADLVPPDLVAALSREADARAENERLREALKNKVPAEWYAKANDQRNKADGKVERLHDLLQKAEQLACNWAAAEHNAGLEQKESDGQEAQERAAIAEERFHTALRTAPKEG